MVLDTSALVALLLDEPEAEEFRAAVEEDTTRLVSAATLLETALVIEARKGEPGGRELDALIHKAEIVVVAVDAEHVSEARRASADPPAGPLPNRRYARRASDTCSVSMATTAISALWIRASSSRPPGSPFRASMTRAVSSSVAAETKRVVSSSTAARNSSASGSSSRRATSAEVSSTISGAIPTRRIPESPRRNDRQASAVEHTAVRSRGAHRAIVGACSGHATWRGVHAGPR